MSVVSMEEGFNLGSAQLVTALDLLLQQKAIELATLGEQFTACVASIAFGLEISGKAVEMRTEQTAPEIDQGAFVFEPGFEHKMLLKNTGTRGTIKFLGLKPYPKSVLPFADLPVKKKPLRRKTRSGYVK